MGKPDVKETRFDFRGGRNTAVSPDLLNDNELVDATNARLTGAYGAITKRGGTQRIHPDTLPAAVLGVVQWDAPSGKQVVAISNGDLYFRNGFDFSVPFQKVATAGTSRSTSTWTTGGGTISHAVNTDNTVTAQALIKLGDPAIDNNVDAADDLYTVRYSVSVDGTGMAGLYAAIDGIITADYSTNDGGAWTPVGGTLSSVSTSIGHTNSQNYAIVLTISGAPAKLWIRLNHRLRIVGHPAVTGNGSTTLSATGQATTWTTGSSRFSLTAPVFFMPFRASTSGAPLVLFIASGGHYFSWDGVATITQLDPTNNAPLTKLIMSYHTRMFAVDVNYQKTIWWSRIGDATYFTTGTKADGGSAVTDFLTGQALTALEVIGSSLLMATADSVMRFTGHAADDIVIAQDTEGVSAEVGSVGPLTLKRFENVAAMLSERGPYGVTETQATPIGEQLQPDWLALDQPSIDKSSIEYHRGQKELFFAVPRPTDGGIPKTIYCFSVRLQAWQGPWIYSFGINCMAKYFNAINTAPNVIAGCADGYIRLMDVGSKDDVLNDGTSGSNITMRVEHPTLHFGDPGVTKTLRMAKVQAKLPSGHNLQLQTGFDGETLAAGSYVDGIFDGTLRDYRIDDDGQGKRLQVVWTDDSAVAPTIYGFVLHAYNMQRP